MFQNIKKIKNIILNISTAAIKNFFTVNGILLSIGTIQFIATTFFEYNISIDFLVSYLILLTRNYYLMHLIENSTHNKINISNNTLPKETYFGEFHINVLKATSIETLTHEIIKRYTYSHFSLYDIVYFIPSSFVFEIIFDFFHYWSHRIIHKNKNLYNIIHKKHHKFSHPIAIITYYQEISDLIITNMIPTFIAFASLYFAKGTTFYTYSLISVYKSFIEISGHIGKKMYPTSSFSQFIWLPKILNIELYTECHDLHHSLNNCNYSKRFSLWDKIFGTYKDIKNIDVVN